MQMKYDDVRIRLIRESLSIQFRFWYVCYANVCMYVSVLFYIIFSQLSLKLVNIRHRIERFLNVICWCVQIRSD